jgi:hypothetical protein
VQFFFRLTGCRTSFALVSQYGEAEANLLHQSHGTLHVVRYQGKQALTIVDARCIKSLIAMVPFVLSAEEAQDNSMRLKYSNCFFVAEKPFIDFTSESTTTYGSTTNGNEDETVADNSNDETEQDNKETDDDSDESQESDGDGDDSDGNGDGINCKL